MRWVTKVSGGEVFVLDMVDWLEHEYTTSSALKLEGLLGVDKGTIFPCFNLYRRYYGLHNLIIEGTHLNLKFTPTDITLVKVKDFDGKVLVIPSIVTQIQGGTFDSLKVDTLDVSHFDTSRVTDMYRMFEGCKAKELDISHFDTHKVTNMSCMFSSCQVKELDVSHFDTSQVTNMRYMFSFCRAKELDVSHFDTSQVTNMSYMFSFCNAKELDVSHFDLSNVKNFSHVFKAFKGIIIGKEHFPKEAFI